MINKTLLINSKTHQEGIALAKFTTMNDILLPLRKLLKGNQNIWENLCYKNKKQNQICKFTTTNKWIKNNKELAF